MDGSDEPVCPGRYVWNCGLPTCRNAILFDEDFYFGNHRLACHVCKSDIAAVIADVREGAFASARAVTAPEASQILGASLDKAKIVVIADNGSSYQEGTRLITPRATRLQVQKKRAGVLGAERAGLFAHRRTAPI